MKILVLKSSGNKKGSSNMLADEFIKGAASNGHEITEYDVIRKNINWFQGALISYFNLGANLATKYNGRITGMSLAQSSN